MLSQEGRTLVDGRPADVGAVGRVFGRGESSDLSTSVSSTQAVRSVIAEWDVQVPTVFVTLRVERV